MSDRANWIRACALEIAADPDCCDIQSSDAAVIEETIIQHHARARCVNCPSCGRQLIATTKDNPLSYEREYTVWACPKMCPPPPPHDT